MVPRRFAFLAIVLCAVLGLSSGPGLSQSIPEIVSRAKPSVLFVFARQPGRLLTGSGFVVHSSGLILTAYHIFSEGGTPGVLAPGGQSVPATLVAHDRQTDLAVLRVSLTGLVPLVLGDSATLRQGEEVIVIGFPRSDALGAHDSSVTRGIVSNLTSRFGWMQIDASLNPGNSGGPVLSLKGEVVGVAVAGLRDAVGINFAVPINHARQMIAAHIRPEVALPAPTPAPAPTFTPTPTPAPTPAPSPVRPSPQPAAPGQIVIGDPSGPCPGVFNPREMPREPRVPTSVAPGVSIGPIVLGMPIADAIRSIEGEVRPGYGASIYREIPGIGHLAHSARTCKWFLKPLFVSELLDPLIEVLVEPAESKVVAIRIQADPRFKTREGVGIGSTEGQIAQALGRPSRTTQGGYGFQGRMLHYDSLGISFTVVVAGQYYQWSNNVGNVWDVIVYAPSRR